MSYHKAAIYLRVHGAKLDKEFQDTRKINKIKKDVRGKIMCYEESKKILTLWLTRLMQL